jgi:hypothetical protein
MTRRARVDDLHEICLVQQSRLGEIDRDELAEMITDAWAARAPRALTEKIRQNG